MPVSLSWYCAAVCTCQHNTLLGDTSPPGLGLGLGLTLIQTLIVTHIPCDVYNTFMFLSDRRGLLKHVYLKYMNGVVIWKAVPWNYDINAHNSGEGQLVQL